MSRVNITSMYITIQNENTDTKYIMQYKSTQQCGKVQREGEDTRLNTEKYCEIPDFWNPGNQRVNAFNIKEEREWRRGNRKRGSRVA